MDTIGQERRRNKRYKHDIVSTWQRPVYPDNPSSDAWLPTLIHNISKGGLCFDVTETIALKNILHFRAQLDITLEPVRCKGEVVWLRKRDQSPATEVGVSFSSINDPDSDLIDVMAWGQDQGSGA